MAIDRSLFARWLIACTAGELLGLGAAGAIGYGLYASMGDPHTTPAKLLVLIAMVLAGALEGTITGSFQAIVLRRRFARLSIRKFAFATALVAASGWLLGMLPSTLIADAPSSGEPMQEPPLALVLLFAALFGAIAGALFGGAQALVLRRHTPHAGRWVIANALGWALALPLTYLAPNLVPASFSMTLDAIVFALAGALAGLVLSLVTGLAIDRLPLLDTPRHAS